MLLFAWQTHEMTLLKLQFVVPCARNQDQNDNGQIILIQFFFSHIDHFVVFSSLSQEANSSLAHYKGFRCLLNDLSYCNCKANIHQTNSHLNTLAAKSVSSVPPISLTCSLCLCTLLSSCHCLWIINIEACCKDVEESGCCFMAAK